jgi:RNA polymerase sigma factor (sigma-70 family)
MPTRADHIVRCVRRIASQTRPEASDSELLKRFVTGRDPAAFEALVGRHGAMVLRVCQRVLGNRHDAEDAFQATFLVLARKAGGVRPSGCLAGWLHGVASRVALGARAAARRRRRDGLTPDLAPPDPRPDPLAELTAREALQILEVEVQRLPKAYRLPVVLCCLHGVTQEEAARQLGWTPGSLKGRLERGRKHLHERLARRGLGLASALALAEISRGTAAGLARNLAAATVKAAVSFASRCPDSACLVPARLIALAGAGLRHAAAGKVRSGLLLLLAVGVVTAALATQAGQAPGEGQPRPPGDTEQARTDRDEGHLPEAAVRRFGSARFRHGAAIRASALSPDGKVLVTAGQRSVIVWDLATRKPLRRFPFDNGSPFTTAGLTFSPDGTRLGYVRGSFFACVWDLRTGKELRRFERRLGDRLGQFSSFTCHFAKEGREFVVVSEKAIETWDLQSGELTTSVPKKGQVGPFSPDGRTYLAIDGKAVLFRCDARTGDEVAGWKAAARYDGLEDGLAFSPDGKILAVVDGQKEVQLREATGGKILHSFPLPQSAEHTFNGQKLWEYRVAFSSDGKTLLLGTRGGIIHRWDCASGKELPPLSRH